MQIRIEEQTQSILEFNSVLEHAAQFAASHIGKRNIGSLTPIRDPDKLKQELETVTQARDCVVFDDPVPACDFGDLEPVFRRAGVLGGFLEPEELMHLQHYLAIIRNLTKYFSERQDKYGLIQRNIRQITSFPDHEGSIRKVI